VNTSLASKSVGATTGNPWARRFGRTVLLGVIVNMFFVVACFFFPRTMCRLLRLKVPDPIIWVRTSGMLLFIISIFYIPAARDPFRYRDTAIMHIIPSRACGSSFFLYSVLARGQEPGFLSIALVDLFFGVVSAIFLFLAFRTEPAPVTTASRG
jgi:hypothetical protein